MLPYLGHLKPRIMFLARLLVQSMGRADLRQSKISSEVGHYSLYAEEHFYSMSRLTAESGWQDEFLLA